MKLSIYYLIGFMNNYSGGFSRENGIFQHISYTEDFEYSEEKVKISKKVIEKCEKTLVESDMENDIKIQYLNDNKGLIIYSKNLTKLIDKLCKSKGYFLGRDYFQIDYNIFDKSNDFHWRDEKSPENKQKVLFIRGMYDSNASDNEFNFYNDYNKCLLVHRIFKSLADEDDEIIMKSYFKTPSVDRIIINKTGDIWKIIEKNCR